MSSDEDHPPAAALGHARRVVLGEPDGRKHVRLEDAAPAFVVDLEDGQRDEGADVVAEDVDVGQFRDQPGGAVGGDAPRAQPRGSLAHIPATIATVDDYLGARGEERARDGLTDARGGPGYQGRAAAKVNVHGEMPFGQRVVCAPPVRALGGIETSTSVHIL